MYEGARAGGGGPELSGMCLSAGTSSCPSYLSFSTLAAQAVISLFSFPLYCQGPRRARRQRGCWGAQCHCVTVKGRVGRLGEPVAVP